MRCLVVVAALLSVAPTAAWATAEQDESVAAVQKVVSMLEDMVATAKRNKQQEAVDFAAFTTWCDDEVARLNGQIEHEASSLTELKGAVAQHTDAIQVLGDEIASLQAAIVKAEADKKAVQEQREKDHAAFLLEQKDQAESLDALDRAIAVMEKQNFDRSSGAAAMLQLANSQQIPDNAQSMISAFLGMMDDKADPDFMSQSAPEANAYEFQSGSIINLLKKLRDEFGDKQGQTEKEEMNSRHAADMILMDLSGTIEHSEGELSAKSGLKAEKQQNLALAKKGFTATTALKKEDEGMLSDTEVECKEKRLSFDEKQQLRTEEIQAIEKAIEILSSDELQNAAAKHLALRQKTSMPGLLAQLRSIGSNSGSNKEKVEGIRRRARMLLMSEAAKLHSKDLQLLVSSLATDPFAKVKQMISNLITRLLEQANEDAVKEGFCDKELGQSKVTRNKLTEQIDGLSAEIEQGKANVAELGKSIATLNSQIAATSAAVAEATALRQEEQGRNKATVEEATAAKAALEQAIAVLKEFYAKASKATALTQVSAASGVLNHPTMGSAEWSALGTPLEGTVDQNHKEGMQTFNEVYRGQDESAGGVFAMLEVILSDFLTLISTTESSEAEAAAAHKKFLAEAQTDTAVKTTQVNAATNDKATAEAKLSSDTADFRNTEDQLAAAESYYENLMPQCGKPGVTFEERTKARQEEISSLKEVLQILGEADDMP